MTRSEQVGQVCELVGASALDSDISKVVHVLLNGDAGWVAQKCLAACDQIGTLLDKNNSPKIIKVAPMHDCVHVKVGRPNYDDIFSEIAGKHDGEIGVFCCGPMGKQLREVCCTAIYGCLALVTILRQRCLMCRVMPHRPARSGR